MSPDLSAVMDDAVKTIHFIQSRPLNHRLFETLCHENGTEHDQLLLHTDVRWLSRGKTLLRLYELRNEVVVFLTEHLHPLAVQLEDDKWVARLAYLADVFTKLNELNLSLQGKESHILKLYDKVQGFTKKLKLWERKCDEGDVSCFPLLNAHLATTAVTRGPVVKLVQAHLSKLCTDFSHYFQDIENKSERLDWMAYAEKSLTEFWCDVEKEYPELGKHALIELLPFGSTYLCEVTFSALTHIKTKQRNRLDVETRLVTAVSTLPPELSKLMKDKQAQVSH
ncbi:hypothetical protein JOQ06_008677 [Pogonophryne albipinna]|uniref:Uncharacterized protein n=1 Tax=Pogonophryne albipinna TaxID=1090488 RepID=A0AAD6F9C4_9TELE|nr:hypothetical protein JOQ06_008677 [Pogonophryne albipinna]